MQFLSHSELDFELAWRRVRHWVQCGKADVPDRLPVEVLDRIFGDQGPPRPGPERHLAPVTLVTASKKSGLARSFARLGVTDLILYQALVDRIAPDIEAGLPPRDVAFGYRYNTAGAVDVLEGSPSRRDYAQRMRQMLDFGFNESSYAITGDIAGYYTHVDIDELERLLLSVSGADTVARDLAHLLRSWQSLGIRGLPQGLRSSSPLGNLYLRPLDRILEEHGAKYVRWMDDFVVAAGQPHEARSLLDALEQRLYPLGLSLAADKTRIRRYDAAYEQSEDASDRLTQRKRARRQAAADWLEDAANWMEYPPNEADLPDPEDLDREEAVETYRRALSQLSEHDLPAGFQPEVVAALRDLAALREPVDLEQIPALVRRAPDITGEALRYIVEVGREDRLLATSVFHDLLGKDRFMRELEKVQLAQAILMLGPRVAPTLAAPMAEVALSDPHSLVRARALLSWGAQSDELDFETADRFWAAATPAWRPYALVAIQAKNEALRNDRYDRWSGEGRFLGQLANLLKQTPIGWRKV